MTVIRQVPSTNDASFSVSRRRLSRSASSVVINTCCIRSSAACWSCKCRKPYSRIRGPIRRQNSASASGSFPAPIRTTISESLSSITISTYFMCNGQPLRYTSCYPMRIPSSKRIAKSARRDSMSAPATVATPYLNSREDAAFRFLGLPTLMRSTAETTNGAYGLMEHWSMPPGFASPYHLHHREDEAFYVLEGDMAFICDGKWQRGGPGTFVFGPRELAHGFTVVGDTPARMLLLCSPGGFEQFVQQLGQ